MGPILSEENHTLLESTETCKPDTMGKSITVEDLMHYTVQHPGTRMKTWDAASPTSRQRNEAPSP
jgi:hypothetical protein